MSEKVFLQANFQSMLEKRYFHLARFIGEIYEVDINYEQKIGSLSRGLALLKYEKIFRVLPDTLKSSNSHMLFIVKIKESDF